MRRVPRVAPGVVFPGVVPEFAGLRDRVEDPQLLAGPRVEPADETGRELSCGCGGPQRRPDDDHVTHNRGGRVQTDLAILDRRAVQPFVEILVEVDDAFLAERGDRQSRSCIQRNEAVAPGDVNDALIIPPVGPVRHAPAGGGANRPPGAAFALVVAVHPQRLAGGAIDGDDVAVPTSGGVQHAANHQRRRLVVEIQPRSEIVRPPPPGDLEFPDVVSVDLIERRVLGAGQVSAVVAPLACGEALLRRSRQRGAESDGEDEEDSCDGTICVDEHRLLPPSCQSLLLIEKRSRAPR